MVIKLKSWDFIFSLSGTKYHVEGISYMYREKTIIAQLLEIICRTKNKTDIKAMRCYVCIQYKILLIYKGKHNGFVFTIN